VQEAREAAERAFETAARSYEASDLELGEFSNRVARAHVMAANYTRAEQLYAETLTVRERSLPDGVLAAQSVSGLAQVALQANENVKAEDLFRRSLPLLEKFLGREHPQVASNVLGLGLIHYRRRDYANAAALFLRALAALEKSFGSDHRASAACLNNLGLVFWRQQD
jgi:tetratricopeptide (TPR) repeat protein